MKTVEQGIRVFAWMKVNGDMDGHSIYSYPRQKTKLRAVETVLEDILECLIGTEDERPFI